MNTPRPPVTPEVLRTLAEHARLPVSDDRAEAMASTA